MKYSARRGEFRKSRPPQQRSHFEMKSRGKKLERFYDQICDYWNHIVPHRARRNAEEKMKMIRHEHVTPA